MSKKAAAKERKLLKQKEKEDLVNRVKSKHQAHKDIMDLLSPVDTCPVDHSKMDFGQYEDHKNMRPYETISDGITWYEDNAEGVPEFMYLPCVAHNFGLTEKQAATKLLTELDRGVVDLS